MADISRMSADKVWLDYQFILLDLLRLIHSGKIGLLLDERLKIVKNNIKKSRESPMLVQTEKFYGFTPDYHLIEEYAIQIGQGNFQSKPRLEEMLNKAGDLSDKFIHGKQTYPEERKLYKI